MSMGWTKDEKLACILENGVIQIMDIEGTSFPISLGEVSFEYLLILKGCQKWSSWRSHQREQHCGFNRPITIYYDPEHPGTKA